MAELAGEQKVYSEFLTSLAVAWFSAGSSIAIIACGLSLRLAILFTK